MEVAGEFISETLRWWAGLSYAVVLIYALKSAPWSRFADSEQLHVFLGAAVVLLLLWHIRATIQPGLSYHLLGMTTLTLMFGWSLSILAAGLALLGVTLNAGADWNGFALNALITGVFPVTLTHVLLVVLRSLLPKNFFIYVLVNGFLTAGLVGICHGYLVTWILVAADAYSYQELAQTLLPLFPLMFLPEAILNGWMVTIMVCFKPQWVYSFSDELYLHGK